jgi:hypothetical protein
VESEAALDFLPNKDLIEGMAFAPGVKWKNGLDKGSTSDQRCDQWLADLIDPGPEAGPRSRVGSDSQVIYITDINNLPLSILE